MALSDQENFANLAQSLKEVLARQAQLEERLQKMELAFYGPTVPPPTAAEPIAEPVAARVVEAPLVELAATVETPALETKVGLTLLNRIGVVTLVLGVAFFFKWAVDNDWVGPTGRVLLGLAAGLAALAIADVLWRKGQQVFAQGITGAGVAIVYLAFYATFDFYHLIRQVAAFLLMLATTALAATLALRYNAMAIAALGFFGAYLIPLLLSSGQDHPWFLLAYLLLLNFAATELASRRQWRLLELFSFVATVLIFAGWLISYGNKDANHWVATVGVFTLGAQRFRTTWPVLFLSSQMLSVAALFWIWHSWDQFTWLSLLAAAGGLAFAHFRRYPPIVATAFAAFWITAYFWSSGASDFMPLGSIGFLLFYAWTWWRGDSFNDQPAVIGMTVFALNGIAYYAVAYSVLDRDHHRWLGSLAIAVGAFYLAFGLANRKKPDWFILSLGVAAAFVTLAIPIQLSGFTVTISWAFLAAVLTWIAIRLSSVRLLMAAIVVFALALLRAAIYDSQMHAAALLFNTRFLTFASLAAAFLLAAKWSARLDRRLALVDFVAGHLVLLGGLCLEVINWAERSAQPANEVSVETIGITILFAVYAVALVSFGVAARSAVSRTSGLILTAVVILKLYLFDVWQLGRVYQIVAFVILGLLLLSTSFLYSRFKGLMEQWRRDRTGHP